MPAPLTAQAHEPATPEALATRIKELVLLFRRRMERSERADRNPHVFYREVMPPRRSRWLQRLFGKDLGRALDAQLFELDELPDAFVQPPVAALTYDELVIDVQPIDEASAATDAPTEHARAVLARLVEPTTFYRVVLRPAEGGEGEEGREGVSMLAWRYVEGRWRYLPCGEIDLDDLDLFEGDAGRQLREQLEAIDERLQGEDDDRTRMAWLAGLFAEAIEDADEPLPLPVLQLAYERPQLLYGLGFYDEARRVLERTLVSFDALTERKPQTVTEVHYTVATTLLALTRERLGDGVGARALLDSLAARPAQDAELQSWLGAARALVDFGSGRTEGLEAAITRYQETCEDRLLRGLEPYRPFVAAARVAALRGDRDGPMRWLGEAIDDVSSGNPTQLSDDGGTLLHDACVLLCDGSQQVPDDVRTELAQALLFHAMGGRSLGENVYLGHRSYASLQLCSHIAAETGNLEQAALAEHLLAGCALALGGDDFGAALTRLEQEARAALARGEAGEAWGTLQVAVDLARRYLPSHAARQSCEELLANLGAGLAPLETRPLPLALLGPRPPAVESASLADRLTAALDDVEEPEALLSIPYLLACWPDERVAAEAGPLLRAAIDRVPPLVGLIAVPRHITAALLAGQPARPLVEIVTALRFGGSLPQLERLLRVLPKLRYLQLQGVALGEPGIERLCRLEGLMALSLPGCGVTEADIERLKRALAPTLLDVSV